MQEEGSDIPLFGNPYRLARGKMDEADDLSLDRRRPSLRNGKRSSSRTSNDRSSPIPFSMSIQPIQSSHAHGDHDISENDASLTSLLREEGDISCSVSFSKPTPKRSKFGTGNCLSWGFSICILIIIPYLNTTSCHMQKNWKKKLKKLDSHTHFLCLLLYY